MRRDCLQPGKSHGDLTEGAVPLKAELRPDLCLGRAIHIGAFPLDHESPRVRDRRKPIPNTFVESFNGRMRDELLNETLFFDLDDAGTKIG